MKLTINGQPITDGATINVKSLDADISLGWEGPEQSITLFINGKHAGLLKNGLLNRSVTSSTAVTLAKGPNRLSFIVYARPDAINKIVGAAAAFSVSVIPAVPQKSQIIMGVCAATDINPNLPVTSRLWEGSKTVVEALQFAGIETIREWWSLDNPKANQPDWNRARLYTRAGMTITLILNWKGSALPTSQDIFKRVCECWSLVPADIRPSIILWEIGNEPAYGEYWKEVGANRGRSIEDCIRNYATLFLQPAYEVLHPLGQKVGCAGLNGMFGKHYGILKATGVKHDVICVHPYQKNTPALIAQYDALMVFNGDGLPIHETESNVFLGPEYKAFLADPKTGMSGDKILAEQKSQHAAKAKYPITHADYFVINQDFKWTTGSLGLLPPVKDGAGRIIGFTTSRFYEQFICQL